MGRLKSQFNNTLLWLVFFSAFSCGEITTTTTPPPPPPAPTATETPAPPADPNHPAGNTAIILAADFTDASRTGTLNLVTLDAPRSAATHLQTTFSDATVRSFDNFLYVVNRKGADNIQVVDPATFTVLQQSSTGVATNPQEIIVLNRSKAYVTLYEPEQNQTADLKVDDLLVIDPTKTTDSILKTIDLTPFTRDDRDRYARASSMVLIRDKLYVALQDLPGNLALPPDQPGKILRIDTTSDRVEAFALLTGRNPFAMTYSPVTGKIYVSCSDFFDLNSPYGGVEVVDPETMTSEGITLDDLILSGSVGEIEVAGNFGFVVVAPVGFASNAVVRFSLDRSNATLKILYTSRGYLQDIAIDQNGILLVGDRDPEVNGVVFVNPESGEVVEGPINVGAPPSSITFVER